VFQLLENQPATSQDTLFGVARVVPSIVPAFAIRADTPFAPASLRKARQLLEEALLSINPITPPPGFEDLS
jgi:hypothetical protein